MPWNWIRSAAALAGILIVPVTASGQVADRAVPQARAEVTLSFAPVVRRAQPAVVNVYASRTEKRARNPLFDDPIFRQFFGSGSGSGDGASGDSTSRSLGSGVIVDSAGLVVTNFHVIEGMTNVKVALSDRREFDAEIALRDQRTDLAVLRLKGASSLPAMELGDSDQLEVGDLALAIGNPFGVGQTVTQGIISAVARTQVGVSDYGFLSRRTPPSTPAIPAVPSWTCRRGSSA